MRGHLCCCVCCRFAGGRYARLCCGGVVCAILARARGHRARDAAAPRAGANAGPAALCVLSAGGRPRVCYPPPAPPHTGCQSKFIVCAAAVAGYAPAFWWSCVCLRAGRCFACGQVFRRVLSHPAANTNLRGRGGAPRCRRMLMCLCVAVCPVRRPAFLPSRLSFIVGPVSLPPFVSLAYPLFWWRPARVFCYCTFACLFCGFGFSAGFSLFFGFSSCRCPLFLVSWSVSFRSSLGVLPWPPFALAVVRRCPLAGSVRVPPAGRPV
jgi:hypothetical protein